ncbi:uncharacterized protein [Heliangelus exortis]|uniref:uncharacterized protein isoform X10 n=1 Tax=Heliangelus exortis TaxID=472823 RepID=UPI003A90210F
MEEPEKERKLLGFGPGLKGSVQPGHCQKWGHNRNASAVQDAPTPPLQNRTRPTAHRTPLKEPGLEGCHAQEHPWPELTGFSLSRTGLAKPEAGAVPAAEEPPEEPRFLLEEFIAPVLSAAQLAFIRKTKYFLFMHQKRVIIGFKEL